MGAKLLMPGFGGQYQSETLDSNSAIGADTLDCSHVNSIMVQVSSASGAGNIDFTQSFNGSDYAAIDASLTNMAVTDGTSIKLDITDQPFGIWRIDGTDISGGTVVVTIVGFPAQITW